MSLMLILRQRGRLCIPGAASILVSPGRETAKLVRERATPSGNTIMKSVI